MKPLEIIANGQTVATLRLGTTMGRLHFSKIHSDARYLNSDQFRLSLNGDEWFISPVAGTVNPTLVYNRPLERSQPVHSGMALTVQGAVGLHLEFRLLESAVPSRPKKTEARIGSDISPYKGLPQPPFKKDARHFCGKCGEGYAVPNPSRGYCFCANCQALAFFLVEAVSQQYRYPWQFLDSTEWPGAGISKTVRGTKERAAEIWMDVARTLSYSKDEGRFNGRADVWQTAAESLVFRVGDCEDHSILLADWLAAEGYRVRVAVGETKSNDSPWQGHSWVVMLLNGVEYLIEATMKVRDGALPYPNPNLSDKNWRPYYKLETATSVASDYRPFFSFDHQHIWTRQGFRAESGGTIRVPELLSSYWAESDWIEGIWLRER